MSSSDDIDEIARRIEREIQRNAEALEEYDEASYEEDVVSQMEVVESYESDTDEVVSAILESLWNAAGRRGSTDT
ncbi:hypothetical protein EXE43_16090 [Halorubrum sp. SS5]|nr:hypothetical protein EXE43_16090 [Halorubrum sp. SS5]